MIISRPPTKSAKALTRAVSRSVVRSTAPAPTYPLSLFAAGEQGAWYDFTDLTSMFQDIAMTLPVVEDARVAVVLDKSGRGNHLTQATSGNRPALRRNGAVWFLEFDGVDDFLVTSSINFTGTDKISVFSGYQKGADTALGVLVELGASVASNVGTFNITAPDSAATNYGFNLNGGTVASRVASPFAALNTHILSCNFDLAQAAAAGEISPRINAATPTLTAVGAAGAGPFGNYPLYVGRRGGVSNPLKGYLVGLVIRGALTSGAALTGTEQQLAGKAGITVP